MGLRLIVPQKLINKNKGKEMNNCETVFDMPPNRLLNSAQAAEYMGYKTSYIYNLVYKGILKPLKTGKREKGALRFIKKDLDKFLGRGDYAD